MPRSGKACEPAGDWPVTEGWTGPKGPGRCSLRAPRRAAERVWDREVGVGVTCVVEEVAFGSCCSLVCACVEWALFGCVVSRGVYSCVWLCG